MVFTASLQISIFIWSEVKTAGGQEVVESRHEAVVSHWGWEACSLLESKAQEHHCWATAEKNKHFHNRLEKQIIALQDRLVCTFLFQNIILLEVAKICKNLQIGLRLCQLDEHSSGWLMQLVELRETVASNTLMKITAASLLKWVWVTEFWVFPLAWLFKFVT